VTTKTTTTVTVMALWGGGLAMTATMKIVRDAVGVAAISPPHGHDKEDVVVLVWGGATPLCTSTVQFHCLATAGAAISVLNCCQLREARSCASPPSILLKNNGHESSICDTLICCWTGSFKTHAQHVRNQTNLLLSDFSISLSRLKKRIHGL
jgi:hypothetical protein